ncbi:MULTISPECIES: hypothetical protein [Pseudomonas]|uniref:hypothetical protein n=1 Tax=Pseudomonas TaxID=286 RepID=UPI002729805C|nr:hypothetical protein [Pseudomonas sp. OVF7]WLD64996.1 hypothetical protein QU606_21885 [Pseudomonas sp. OVF7]
MKLLYEFKEVFGDDDIPEVLISRLSDENNELDKPDFTVRVSSFNNDGEYYVITKPEDVDGDGKGDKNDALYYELAAKLVTDLVTLSDIGDKKRFSRILIRFKPGSTTDIEILHFKDGNNIISAADFIVTVTNPDRYGKYREVKDLIDADGDGDADSNDRLIYRKLATSFASMKDPRP